MRRYTVLVAILVPFLTSACKRDDPQSNVTELPDPVETTENQVAAAGLLTGDVVETMDANQYTYVQIDTGVEKVWAAGPKCEVKVGDKLGISTGMPMFGFHSPVLERDFDLVYFVGGFRNPDGTPQQMASHGAPGTTPQGRSSGPVNAEVGTVEKAEGGKTVAEICTQKDELAGSVVKFRGKVTKYNEKILGVNWLHVQDGSGDAASKTHDLTVTTTAIAKVGDTVLVTGKLQLNKDFGAGYKYAMIVEEADVVVE